METSISRLHFMRRGPDGIIRLKVIGHVTTPDTKPGGVNLFESIVGPGWRQARIVIDFSDCEYMDSGALGWLIDANRQIKEAGGKLAMHSLSETVKRVFNMMRMEHVFTIASDEGAAAALLRDEAEA